MTGALGLDIYHKSGWLVLITNDTLT
jgi:hypothetical protein